MTYRAFVLLVFLATAAVNAADTVVEAPEVGFRLVIPDVGWTHAVERGPAGATSVTVGPSDRGRGVQLSIATTMVAARSDDATGTRDALIEYANAQPGIADVRRVEERMALRAAPGLALEQEAQGRVYRLRIAFLHADGIQYRMQFHAPRDEFERLWPTARRILDGFELVEVDPEVRTRQQLRAVAGRCGSQIDWADDWDAAATRARAEGRLIAVGIHAQGGFELGNQLMEGVFSEPDIVALMQHRFVGMTWRHGQAAPFALPEVFGLSGTTFGVGILVCDPQGNVLRQIFLMHPGLVIESMRHVLLEHPDLAPPPPTPTTATRAEHAAFLLDSGQLTAAARFLGVPSADETVALTHQRVRLHRLQRRSAAALAALDLARAAPDAETRRVVLDLEEGWIRMGRGANGAARACLERAAAQGAAAERAEAELGLGLLDWADGDRAGAAARWTRLARAHPDEPAAWRAAAGVAGPALRIDRAVSLAWLDAAASAVAVLPAPAVEPFEADDALADAVLWLAARQRADGGWDCPFGLRGAEPAPDPVATATHALAVLALARGSAALDSTFSAAADPGVQSGVRRYLEDRALQRAYPSPVAFMDYTCWGSAYGLFGLLGLQDLGYADPAVAEELEMLVADLVRVQQGNGGWSYYQSATLDGASVGAAMSFTTATVLLALHSARDHGVAVPPEVLERGAACLRSLRGPGGNFQYSRMGAGPFAAGSVGPAGAAGRGPLCTMALARAGDDVVQRWTPSFRTFVEYLPTYGAQSRRALMHAGADGQGSHYLLYDYATAAEALRAADGVDAELRTSVETAILHEMARCRSADGSFVDNPLLGQAAGTSLAVLTLLELREE